MDKNTIMKLMEKRLKIEYPDQFYIWESDIEEAESRDQFYQSVYDTIEEIFADTEYDDYIEDFVDYVWESEEFEKDFDYDDNIDDINI